MNMSSRNWLVVASFVLSITAGWAVSRNARGPAAATGGRPLIGLSLDTLKDERWQRDRDLFVARANEL